MIDTKRRVPRRGAARERHLVNRAAAATLLLLTGLIAPGPLAAQVATISPRDDASLAPSFIAFRSELLQAVERRDTAAVIAVLAEDVLPGFGGDRGIDGFRRAWFDDAAGKEEDLWSVLREVLSAGGVLTNDSTFVAPYVFASFPDDLDAFRHGVVMGTGVRVRQEPGLHGEVLTTLSHAVVPVPRWHDLPAADGYEWVEVELADGRRGYVAGAYVRSPLDYRAVFALREGRWRLRSLVAGD